MKHCFVQQFYFITFHCMLNKLVDWLLRSGITRCKFKLLVCSVHSVCFFKFIILIISSSLANSPLLHLFIISPSSYLTRYFILNILFLQYCMMEHFFNCDYKVLCCSISELPQNIRSLSKEQLEELRQLPSFRRYVDTLPKKEKAPLLLDDHHFKVSKVSDYSKSAFCILRCVSNILWRAEIVSLVHLLIRVFRPRTDLIETRCKIPTLNFMRPFRFWFGTWL